MGWSDEQAIVVTNVVPEPSQKETLQERVLKAQKLWEEELAKSNVEEQVIQILNDKAERYIRESLGFRYDRWDGYKLDPYNNSPINDAIKNKALEAAHRWVEESLTEATFSPDDKLKKSIRAAYARGYKEAATKMAENIGHRDAETYITNLVGNLGDDF